MASTDYGTYNARVLMQQGSTKLVCTTGGEIEMRTGSLFEQQVGSTMSLSGKVSVETTGSFCDENYEAITKSTTSLKPRGVSRVYSSANSVYTLVAPPHKGLTKHIVSYSTFTAKVRAAVQIGYSSLARVVTFNNPTSAVPSSAPYFAPGVTLYAASTSAWQVVGIAGTTADVVFSSAT